MEEEIEITAKNYIGYEEYYYACFSCPKCKNEELSRSDKYCSNCGVKLKFNEDTKTF